MRRGTTRVLLITAALLGVGVALAVAGRADRPASTVAVPTPVLIQPSGPPVLVGAGDIASCGTTYDEATARIVATIPGTVIALGDNAYEHGSARDFANCYAPGWGAFRERTRPVPGNHEYATRDASAYFDYFGPAAGNRGQGWYAYDLGGWRVYALNSNCERVGGCGPGSAQLEWLRTDLAANLRRCVLAYWHHPRFSSARHDDQRHVGPLWDVLYAAGADVVVSAHDHVYERFAPQDPSGRADPERGIRQFTVGTGGAELYGFRRAEPTTEVRSSDTWGVIVLSLRSDAYDWRFVPAEGGGFTDQGTTACH